jgi:hypothetical protein
MSAPAVVIRLEIEAHPVIILEALSEDEKDRLADWIDAHEEYGELIRQAVKLVDWERAA